MSSIQKKRNKKSFSGYYGFITEISNSIPFDSFLLFLLLFCLSVVASPFLLFRLVSIPFVHPFVDFKKSKDDKQASRDQRDRSIDLKVFAERSVQLLSQKVIYFLFDNIFPGFLIGQKLKKVLPKIQSKELGC